MNRSFLFTVIEYLFHTFNNNKKGHFMRSQFFFYFIYFYSVFFYQLFTRFLPVTQAPFSVCNMTIKLSLPDHQIPQSGLYIIIIFYFVHCFTSDVYFSHLKLRFSVATLIVILQWQQQSCCPVKWFIWTLELVPSFDIDTKLVFVFHFGTWVAAVAKHCKAGQLQVGY